MDPSEVNIFQLFELMRHDRAAVLREVTLRFRQATKEASERAHALGLPVADGRPGEPLPPEENWEGIPAREPVTIEDTHLAVLDTAVEEDECSKRGE